MRCHRSRLQGYLAIPGVTQRSLRIICDPWEGPWNSQEQHVQDLQEGIRTGLKPSLWFSFRVGGNSRLTQISPYGALHQPTAVEIVRSSHYPAQIRSVSAGLCVLFAVTRWPPGNLVRGPELSELYPVVRVNASSCSTECVLQIT